MKVHVTRTVTLPVTPTATVHYPEGFRGTAPRAHIERIEAVGAGKRYAEKTAKAPTAEPTTAASDEASA